MLKKYEDYKETQISYLGSLPSHWNILPLRSILFERKEKNIGKKNNEILSVMANRGVILYSEKGNVGNKASDNIERYNVVYEDDIVLNCMNVIIGSVGRSPYNGVLSPVYYVLVNRNTQTYNTRYYDYVFKLKPLQSELKKYGKGILAHRMRISMDSLKSLNLPCPPIEEQNQVVKYLDWKLSKINKLIRAKKKQIALLNEQKQVIINNAVTKGLDSHAKLKESGISGLGSIPSTWSVKPLKYWAKSNLQSLNSSTEADFEFDYLDISSVGFGYVKQEPVHYRFDEAPSRARRVVKYGDTIISTVRTYLRSMCFIDHDIEHCIVSTGFSVLSPIEGTVLPEILSYALSSDYFVNEVIKNSIGVSYPAINDKKLLSLKVALPSSIEEQLELYNEIKTKTTLLDKGILSIKQQVSRLEEYRTRLISDVVTGKVDVR
ncbi:MAG TPA: restriction endonuclease subunit S, partial [Fervidobacterium nodosum]|nr:restriction endonuclease subunit S [Fervidobacterium nodosum]